METIENLSIQLADVLEQKEQLMEQEKKLKNNIMAYMALNKKQIVDAGCLVINYRTNVTRTCLNADLLKKQYPDVYEDCRCWKETKVKPYLIINRKAVKK